MAPRTRNATAFAGSRALGYEESFFKNRNDMLQSALDAALLKYSDDMEKYQAAVAIYRDQVDMIAKEKATITKTIDDLKKKQIDETAAAKRFNATQSNTTARTKANIDASDKRFNASRTFSALRTAGAAPKSVNQTLLSEVNQAYTQNPADIVAGMDAVEAQQRGTVDVPKTQRDRDIAAFTTFSTYLGDEVRKPAYAGLPADQQEEAAAAALLATLPPDKRASVERGLAELQTEIDSESGMVAAAPGIPTTGVRPADYSALIAEQQARLAALEEARAPERPEEPDLIKLQRDEYFRSFFPGYTPAYQVNELARRALTLDKASEDLIKRYIADVTMAESASIPSISGERLGATGATGRARSDLPSGLGSPVYGETSPFFAPTGLTKAETAIIGQQLFEDELAKLTGKTPNEVANDLFGRGLVLVVDKKPDGRILYTIERAASQGVADLVRSPTESKFVITPERPVTKTTDFTEAFPKFDKNVQVAPPSPSREDIVAGRIEALIAAKASADKEAASAAAIYNDALSKNLDEKTLSLLKSNMYKAQMESTSLDPIIDKAIESRAGFKAEIESLDAPFTYPFEKRGGETVPFFRQPGGPADVRELKKIKKEKPSPSNGDASMKIKSAEEGFRLASTGDLDSILKTDVGRAVEDLYKANQAKGDQSLKDILGYIAQEYPRIEDQKKAATALYGLEYKTKTSTKLG